MKNLEMNPTRAVALGILAFAAVGVIGVGMSDLGASQDDAAAMEASLAESAAAPARAGKPEQRAQAEESWGDDGWGDEADPYDGPADDDGGSRRRTQSPATLVGDGVGGQSHPDNPPPVRLE